MPQIPDLHEQVEQFKHWAAQSDQRSGEWECDYEDWNSLWDSAEETINLHRDGSIPTSVADDLIYAIARDNECQYIQKCLVNAPDLIVSLAKRVLLTTEAHAKWQIADSIAEARLVNAADLLRPFLSDEDEYVRRRALMSIATFAPQEAEAIALRNLNDGYEYTRIAALHVLHAVGSSQLTASLDRLATDANEYVRHNVEQLRAARKDA